MALGRWPHGVSLGSGWDCGGRQWPVARARCQALSPQLMQQQAALVAAHSAYLSPMATMAVQMQHMGTVNPNGLIATPLPPSSGMGQLPRGTRGWAYGDTRDGTWDMGDTRNGGHQGWRTWDMGDKGT